MRETASSAPNKCIAAFVKKIDNGGYFMLFSRIIYVIIILYSKSEVVSAEYGAYPQPVVGVVC